MPEISSSSTMFLNFRLILKETSRWNFQIKRRKEATEVEEVESKGGSFAKWNEHLRQIDPRLFIPFSSTFHGRYELFSASDNNDGSACQELPGRVRIRTVLAR